jgi:hypothetical protein
MIGAATSVCLYLETAADMAPPTSSFLNHLTIQPRPHLRQTQARKQILKRDLPDSRLWLFDEIHQHRSWPNRPTVATNSEAMGSKKQCKTGHGDQIFVLW